MKQLTLPHVLPKYRRRIRSQILNAKESNVVDPIEKALTMIRNAHVRPVGLSVKLKPVVTACFVGIECGHGSMPGIVKLFGGNLSKPTVFRGLLRMKEAGFIEEAGTAVGDENGKQAAAYRFTESGLEVISLLSRYRDGVYCMFRQWLQDNGKLPR